jgi:hypothetical protein
VYQSELESVLCNAACLPFYIPRGARTRVLTPTCGPRDITDVILGATNAGRQCNLLAP